MPDIATIKLLLLYFVLGCPAGAAVDIYRRQVFKQVNADCTAAPAKNSYRMRCMVTAGSGGVLFLLGGLFYQPGLPLVFCWFFLSILLLQTLIDYDCQLLPDKISLLLLLAGFFYAVYFQKNLTDVLSGFFAAGTIMLLIYLLSRGGMGFGDVKLAAVLGVWLGLDKVLLCLLLAFLTGGAAGMVLLLAGARKRRDAIAFGPFLCLGAAAAMLWGDRLLSWYWQLFILN